MSDLDCDDEDSSVLNTTWLDQDCDGVLTSEDCDDSNPNASDIANDADCDGILSDVDCDDEDSAITTTNEDPANCE